MNDASVSIVSVIMSRAEVAATPVVPVEGEPEVIKKGKGEEGAEGEEADAEAKPAGK